MIFCLLGNENVPHTNVIDFIHWICYENEQHNCDPLYIYYLDGASKTKTVFFFPSRSENKNCSFWIECKMQNVFSISFNNIATLIIHYYCSHTKYVSKLQGESFHFNPLPSRFHSSRQFSSSPFSYWKLFGSPAFQLVNEIGRPFAIQKKLPSSAKSVPDVQKCSFPNPIVLCNENIN